MTGKDEPVGTMTLRLYRLSSTLNDENQAEDVGTMKMCLYRCPLLYTMRIKPYPLGL